MRVASVLASLMLLAGAGISGGALAACSDTQVNGAQLAELLPGRYACAADSRPEWGWKFQELHVAPNTLRDYKRGPTHATDPSKNVGTWAIVGDSVQYSYADASGSSGPFAHTVHDSGGGSYSVCQGGVEVATLQDNGGSGCTAGGRTSVVFRGQSVNTTASTAPQGQARGQR